MIPDGDAVPLPFDKAQSVEGAPDSSLSLSEALDALEVSAARCARLEAELQFTKDCLLEEANVTEHLHAKIEVAEARVLQLDSQLCEANAVLESVMHASRGESISDFMESYPVAHTVQDLWCRVLQLEAEMELYKNEVTHLNGQLAEALRHADTLARELAKALKQEDLLAPHEAE